MMMRKHAMYSVNIYLCKTFCFHWQGYTIALPQFFSANPLFSQLSAREDFQRIWSLSFSSGFDLCGSSEAPSQPLGKAVPLYPLMPRRLHDSFNKQFHLIVLYFVTPLAPSPCGRTWWGAGECFPQASSVLQNSIFQCIPRKSVFYCVPQYSCIYYSIPVHWSVFHSIWGGQEVRALSLVT